MATRGVVIIDSEFTDIIRGKVLRLESGVPVRLFDIAEELEEEGIHCESDELLATLVSPCPMMIEAEILLGAVEGQLKVRLSKV